MEKKRLTASDKRKQLRGLIQSGEPIMAPGIYDAFCARMAERAGFSAVYMTGNGVSACLLGQPDVGLITLTEVVQHAGRIASALNIPLIADADTGYGNALNVMRTVREFEAAGVAAIHIEDQVSPKKCGHLPGERQVVSEQEQVLNIQAAVEARQDPHFLLIARTDARSAHGLDEAIRRAKAYHAAGADVVFVELTGSNKLEETRIVAQRVDAPLMVNMGSTGPLAMLTRKELREMKIALAIYPGVVRTVVVKAVTRALTQMKGEESLGGVLDQMATFDEYNDVLGWGDIQALEKRFVVGTPDVQVQHPE